MLLVIDGLGWGGSQRQIANLAVGLSARGHFVHLFVYRPESSHVESVLRGSGVEVVEYSKRWKLDPGVPIALARHARSVGFDAAVAFLPTPSTYAVLAGRAARIPVVASERGFFLAGPLAIGERLRRQPLRFAAHVTANSHHQCERLLREFPWLAGRCTTIWNGIDTVMFRPAAAVPAAHGALRVLGAGTIGPVKQIDVLARALVALARDGTPPVTVSWAGNLLGEPQSRAVRREVDALLAQHGLTDHWNWLGLRTDIAALHHSHDVLVHPSSTEGLPNALCEALTSGLPIVASRAADHALLVGNGERGALFEPRDPDSLATALAHMASLGADARHAMGARARAFAERELSLEVYIGRYETLLRDVIATGPHPRAAFDQQRPTES